MKISSNPLLNNLFFTYSGTFVGFFIAVVLLPNVLISSDLGFFNSITIFAIVSKTFLQFGFQQSIFTFWNKNFTESERNQFAALSITVPFILSLLYVFLLVVLYSLGIDLYFDHSADFYDFPIKHLVPLLAINLCFFDLFFNYAKSMNRSEVGVFLNDLFPRILNVVLLIAFYFDFIVFEFFLNAYVLIHAIKNVIIYIIVRPHVSMNFKKMWSGSFYRQVMIYSFWAYLSIAVGIFAMEAPKTFLIQEATLRHVAYFVMGFNFANLVALPGKSLRVLTQPIFSKGAQSGRSDGVSKLLIQSNDSILLPSAILMMIILANLQWVYYILPKEYHHLEYFVAFVCLAKFYENFQYQQSGILLSSKHHKVEIGMGVLQIVLLFFLIKALFPMAGLLGAGLAFFATMCLVMLTRIFILYRFEQVVSFNEKQWVQLFVFTGSVLVTYLIDSTAWENWIKWTLKSMMLALLIIKYYPELRELKKRL